LHKFQRLGDLPGSLTISFDATGRELYESIRVGLSFDRAIKNLELFATRNNHIDRRIGINMVVHERNVDDILPMADLVASLGFHYLAVIPCVAFSYLDHMNESEEVKRNDTRVLGQIDEIRQRYPLLTVIDYFRSPSGNTWTGDADYCTLPWSLLSFDPTGAAHPCCRAHGIELWRWADDGDQWRGAKIERLRGQLSNKHLDKSEFLACYICPMRSLSALSEAIARPGDMAWPPQNG